MGLKCLNVRDYCLSAFSALLELSVVALDTRSSLLCVLVSANCKYSYILKVTAAIFEKFHVLVLREESDDVCLF